MQLDEKRTEARTKGEEKCVRGVMRLTGNVLAPASTIAAGTPITNRVAHLISPSVGFWMVAPLPNEIRGGSRTEGRV